MISRRVVSIGLAVSVALALAALALAQGGGPPPGGGGGRPPGGDMQVMTYLEKTWTAVCFQLDCTAEQQESLKATYASALQTRNQVLEQALKNRDMTAMQKAAQTCKTTLDTKLKTVLSDEQWQKLATVTQATAPPPPPQN